MESPSVGIVSEQPISEIHSRKDAMANIVVLNMISSPIIVWLMLRGLARIDVPMGS